MVTIGFQDIIFKDNDDAIRALFYTRYYFDIPKTDLDAIGTWQLEGVDIAFSDISEQKAWNKLSRIVEQGLQNLTHLLYKKPTFYIHEDSGVPLIGSNEFGVIDRGSNILEIKPLTGCNFNCVYCSVDEGKNNKTYDYLVQKEYLVETTRWVAANKKHPVECNIGPQGEPLLYPKFVELVRELQEIPEVQVVSVNTNGSLLSKKLIDELAEAGLTRINLSLNAVEQEAANKLAGTAYPLERIKEMITYCQEKEGPKIAVLLAPTLVPGYNENQMEGLVQISKGINSKYPTIGIQNFLKYPKGRNPAKSWKWEQFYTFIDNLEKKTGKSLRSSMEDFDIVNEPELPKPFKKNQTIKAQIVMPGRYPKEMVAASGSGQNARCITIVNAPSRINTTVKLKIVRDKHNIYKGVVV